MANLYFSSDEHFGHARIIEYTNRPFKNVDEMNKELIRRFNERVKDDDTCIIVGDFCFKNSPGGKEGEGLPVHAKNYIKQLNGYKVFVRGNHDCFSLDTRILTKNGYKYYNEVKIGDLIPTVNLVNKCVEFQPIQTIVINNIDKSYIIKNKSFDGIFSNTHRHYLPTFNSNTTNSKRFSGRWLWKIKNSEEVINSCYAYIPTTCPSKNKDINISDDILRLFAWIHTDGYIDRTHDTLGICQSKIKNIKKIKSLLKKLGITYHFSKRIRNISQICGKELKTILPCCEFKFRKEESLYIKKLLKLDNDKFSPFLYLLSDAQMRKLVSYLVDGDGSYTSSGSIQIWGKKESLDKWMGLLVTHNIDCSVNKDKRGSYYLCVHTKKVTDFSARQILKNDMSIVLKETMKWDVTVKNHIIFVERNGKPFITGNSNNSVQTKIERLVLKIGGMYINVCHKPEDAVIEDKEYYPLNLVGHVHNNWTTKEITKNGKYSLLLNVGVDVHKFYPINFDEIKAMWDKWLSAHKNRKEIQRCLTQSQKNK